MKADWIAPELKIARGGHDIQLERIKGQCCHFCRNRLSHYQCRCGMTLCKICAIQH